MNLNPIRRRGLGATLAVTAALTVGGGVVAAAPAQAAYCGIYWGSLAKSSNPMVRGAMTNVRTGRHACYDRIVLDLKGTTRPGYLVKYVSNVYADASGKLVPLRGGAKLQIVLKAPAYDSSGRATYRPTNPRELRNVAGYRTFRQVAFAGSFEGQTTVGLGVRARLPFRTWTYTDSAGSHLVVDVAHAW